MDTNETKIFTGALIAAAVIGLGLAFFAWQQRNAALGGMAKGTG